MSPEKDAGGRPKKSITQQRMFEGSGDSGRTKSGRGPSHLKGTRSLERLRDRIELAAKELYRLRTTNAELQKKLETYRSHDIEPSEGTAVVFAEGPSVLRSKVESCIEAIDRYLQAPETKGEDRSPSGVDRP